MNDQSDHPSDATRIGTLASALPEDETRVGRSAHVTGCCSPLTTSWLLNGTPESVREGLVEMMASVASCGTTEELIHSTEMALAEVFNNVVEHAYEGRTDGWIKVEIACTPADLRVRVSDRGRAMPGLAIPEGKERDLDVPMEDMPEGGFGWFIIRSLTQDLAYSRQNDLNVTTFRMLDTAESPL